MHAVAADSGSDCGMQFAANEDYVNAIEQNTSTRDDFINQSGI
jgi:hypothetical protein